MLGDIPGLSFMLWMELAAPKGYGYSCKVRNKSWGNLQIGEVCGIMIL